MQEHECKYVGPFKESLGIFGKSCFLEALRNARLRLLSPLPKAKKRIDKVFHNESKTHISVRRDFMDYPHAKRYANRNNKAISTTVSLIKQIQIALKEIMLGRLAY